MRCGGLSKRADVVAPALDGQQRGLADGARIDLVAAVGELPLRQLGSLEGPVDGLHVELLRHVEDGEVLVVEVLDLRGFLFLAIGEVMIELAVCGRVARHVHGHEGDELDEARVDAPPAACIATRDGVNDRVLEPRKRFGDGELIDLGRAFARIDRSCHQRHRDRCRGMVRLRHDGDGSQCLHARLADGEDVAARTDHVEELDEIVEVVIDAERARFQRHVARVRPVGKIDVVIDEHRADGAGEQRREVPRQRRHDQDARLWRVDILGEVEELAEGQVERDLLRHGDIAIADADAVDVERRPRVGELKARDHREGGHEVAAERTGEARGIAQRPAGARSEYRHQVVLELVGLIKHRCRAPKRLGLRDRLKLLHSIVQREN